MRFGSGVRAQGPGKKRVVRTCLCSWGPFLVPTPPSSVMEPLRVRFAALLPEHVDTGACPEPPGTTNKVTGRAVMADCGLNCAPGRCLTPRRARPGACP